MDEIRKKNDEEFEKSLPISRDIFSRLFDHLDVELGNKECNNTLEMTKLFLSKANVTNLEMVLNWLRENGAGCDCEVISNIEESFL